MTVTVDKVQDMLNELNLEQRRAAETIYGPVLVLAGAGSGKTTTMTYRIANMLSKDIKPGNMFVATFTNKAANEMKNRIEHAVGKDLLDRIWIGTFHSLCNRILRRHAEKIGYEKDFSIYDPKDVGEVIERIYKMHGIHDDYKPGVAMHYIDSAKNRLQTPEFCLYHRADTPVDEVMARVYDDYQRIMREANAMDFGDLIMNTVLLLEGDTDVREYWQSKFEFVFADEYQDTNHAQFKLLQHLAYPQNNIFAVGDDFQSIYSFRGSDISNILSFEKHYFPCTIVYLEQNYRSNEVIVEAGNELIKNNTNQKEKNLYTEQKGGGPIQVVELEHEFKEAAFVGMMIRKMVLEENFSWKDFAILYRNNSMSAPFEQLFYHNMIPYRVIGGHSFFQREEIKDIVAYLRVVHNRKDDAALLRILNKPSRGIGKTSKDLIVQYANDYKISIYRSLKNVDDIAQIKKRANTKIKDFLDLLKVVEDNKTHDLPKYVRYVLEKTGYAQMWKSKNTKESQERLDNLDEFVKLVTHYQEENPEKSLSDFLQEISLLTELDEDHKEENVVTLMTLHASKGLEFPVVFIVGCNEGVFPSWRSRDVHEIEEERRLAYVGITRAKSRLFMTYPIRRQRPTQGMQIVQSSRFLDEIPSHLVLKRSIS